MVDLILAMSLAVGVSFICSLLEAMLYSVPLSHIESLIERGRAAGRILKSLRDDIDAPISAILTLNTIAHTVGASLAGAAAAKVFGSAWLGVFSGVFTLIVLVFSEIIPKTAGVVFARPLAEVLARPLQWMVWALYPFVWLSRQTTKWIFRETAIVKVSEDDIRQLARIGWREGSVRPQTARIIENIISLEERRVHEIMTPRTVVTALPAAMTVEEARKQEGFAHFSRFPVHDESYEDIIGIVLRRDILVQLSEGRNDITLDQFMMPVHFVAESFTIDDVLAKFLRIRQHMFPVVDEYGGLAGVVTLEDVLEEILGDEIVDESDVVTDMRTLARIRRSQAVARVHESPK
jgi:CBS domain containing-hemolysin-like protein